MHFTTVFAIFIESLDAQQCHLVILNQPPGGKWIDYFLWGIDLSVYHHEQHTIQTPLAFNMPKTCRGSIPS